MRIEEFLLHPRQNSRKNDQSIANCIVAQSAHLPLASIVPFSSLRQLAQKPPLSLIVDLLALCMGLYGESDYFEGLLWVKALYFEVKGIRRIMQERSEATFFTRLTSSPAFRSLMLFSAFRAVYGMGILVVTYFLATSGNAPIWTSILFLLFSMVFSRVLFRFIKRKWSKPEDHNESIIPTTAV